jgi:hypothetical protein
MEHLPVSIEAAQQAEMNLNRDRERRSWLIAWANWIAGSARQPDVSPWTLANEALWELMATREAWRAEDFVRLVEGEAR